MQAIQRDPDPKRVPAFLKRYIKNSRPKTGWNDTKSLNHFDLIQEIHRAYPMLRPALVALCRPQLLQRVRETLDSEFRPLMSALRREMILTCLKQRLHELRQRLPSRVVSDTPTKDTP